MENAIVELSARDIDRRPDELVAFVGNAERSGRRKGWVEADSIRDYALDADGTRAGCVFFYKQLGQCTGPA